MWRDPPARRGRSGRLSWRDPVARRGASPGAGLHARRAGALLAVVLVAGAGFALANGAMNGSTSLGGASALARNFPADAAARLAGGERVTAAYVGFDANPHPPGEDRIERFDARGRLADTTLFHRVALPDGTLGVGWTEPFGGAPHGLLVAEGGDACFFVSNGPAVAHAVLAKSDIEVRYIVAGGFDAAQTAPDRVVLTRDGHGYRLEAPGATIEVLGANVRVLLANGTWVHGAIEDEEAQGAALRAALASRGGCARPAEAPPPEAVPPSPVEGPDVGVALALDAQGNDSVAWRLDVASVGTEPAGNVTLEDPLPTLPGADWFLGGPDAEACRLSGGGLLACSWASIAPGENRTVMAHGYTRGGCGPLAHEAAVSAAGDVNPANDRAAGLAELAPCPPQPSGADVSVAIAEVHDAENVTYTVALANAGPDTAVGDGVYLNGTLPSLPGADWFLGGPDAEACVLEGGALTCHWEEVAVGAARTVTVHGYSREACGAVAATATSWAANDATAGNDTATATFEVPCPDASLAVTPDANARRLVLAVAVAAAGPGSSEAVGLEAALPDLGRAWTLGGDDAEACTLEGLALRCDFGDLAEGASRRVSVRAYTDHLACGEVHTGTASVASARDGVPANDVATLVASGAC